MKKFKDILISWCERLILWLEPGIEIPKERLNYKKAVDSIVSQSSTGRLAFFKQLALNLDQEDRRKLSVLLLDPKISKLSTNGSQATTSNT